jgi:hypothetical protein
MKPKITQPAATTLTIVLPYAGADLQTPYWSRGEDQVDWDAGGPDADRCTVAFAAVELRDHLVRTVPQCTIVFSAVLPAAGRAIVLGPAATLQTQLGLTVKDVPADAQGYVIRTIRKNRLVLAGGGREGTLYAVYAWLGELGWRWQTPGPAGEIAPAERSDLPLAGWDIATAPDFDLFRGFHVAFKGMESPDLFRWMARHRLNGWRHHPESCALLRKLGFRFMSGGHVLETILDPDLPQPDGRTLFEAHPDWFAEVDGKRERPQAHRYQFCVANKQAVDHVARHVVEHCRTDWKDTDWQNLWMFDTWAGWCQCDRCRALGNDADRYLHFLSRMRAAVDAKLTRSPGLVLVAYEGTPSLEGPTRGIPDNLASGRDLVLYAPINRCYAHTLEDATCGELNAHYARAVEAWGREAHRMPLAVVEYYNVSKFEDLPVLFTRTMGPDFAYYHRVGVRGMSYMHIPVTLWGPRALTQLLYARLAWDAAAPVAEMVADYLARRYGPAAEPMREFYAELELAYANVTAWRNWLEQSVNKRLLAWDGVTRPTQSVFVLQHLQPAGGEAVGPRESLAHLDHAAAALQLAQALRVAPAIRRRLEEDARSFRYGDESFRFYWAVAQLYEAERLGRKAAARAAWQRVDRLAVALDAYLVPFDYEYPGPGVRTRTGLGRTQLQPLVDKLRERYTTG